MRALDPWHSLLVARIEAEGWKGEPGKLVIAQGHETYRTDLLYRQVSEFLRARGWNTQKAIHALRAYAGSQVAMRYGIYEASGWLRHKTVLVTQAHYTQYVKQYKPANIEALPARWATLKPTVVTPQTAQTAPPGVPANIVQLRA